jgi:flagellar biosynthesis chaperone FliJ
MMRELQSSETPDERSERLTREAQERRDQIEADDRAVHEMIRRNLELHGP